MRWGGYHTEASAVAEDAGLCGCVAWESNVERWCASDGSQGTPLMRGVSGVHLVHVSHYLPRPLLGWIRDHPRLVAVGGSVVVHTFMRGCELLGRPTKPKFLLEAGELRGLFEGEGGKRWDAQGHCWRERQVEDGQEEQLGEQEQDGQQQDGQQSAHQQVQQQLISQAAEAAEGAG